LRALKSTLPMDGLRCPSPELVRKEVWAHLLGYNLIRGLMAQAAAQAQVRPAALSFTAALRTVNAFVPLLRAAATAAAAGAGGGAGPWGGIGWGTGLTATSRARPSGGPRTTRG